MLDAVMDYDMDTFSYKRLFFHEHLLVGGVLIGPAVRDRAPLLQIVKERRQIPNDERRGLLTLGPSPTVREAELQGAALE